MILIVLTVDVYWYHVCLSKVTGRGGQRCFILFSVGDGEVNGEVGVHYSHEWVSFTLEE